MISEQGYWTDFQNLQVGNYIEWSKDFDFDFSSTKFHKFQKPPEHIQKQMILF